MPVPLYFMKTNKVATYGLLVALAFILSYVETLIPVPVPVPGVKLGLANLVVVTALYTMGDREAFSLSVVRIILVAMTFGNLSTMLFSMAGGILSCIAMIFVKRTDRFGLPGVSLTGGIMHNVGQILVAMFIVHNVRMIYYLPFLLISGVVTGIAIGVVAGLIIRHLSAYRHQ